MPGRRQAIYTFFIQEIPSENVGEMLAILSRPQCINHKSSLFDTHLKHINHAGVQIDSVVGNFCKLEKCID